MEALFDGVCDLACVDCSGGRGGGFTNRGFAGLEVFLEGNGEGTRLALMVLETFRIGGGLSQLAFIG